VIESRVGFTLILSALILSGCASAPFSDPPTARNLGDGKYLLSGGYQETGGAALRFGHGFLERIDAGLQFEIGLFTTFGGWGRYGFLPPSSAFALAVDAGAGSSASDSYYGYGALVASYKWEVLEPMVSVRYNYVRNREEFDFTVGNQKFVVENKDFAYLYYTLGATVWPWEPFGIYLQGSFMKTVTGNFVDHTSFAGVNVGLVGKF